MIKARWQSGFIGRNTRVAPACRRGYAVIGVLSVYQVSYPPATLFLKP